MDTSFLHSRIADYKEKAKHPTSKEMINLFESWLLAIDNYLSEIELDNFELQKKVDQGETMIKQLAEIIVITGNGDKLLLNLDDEYTKEAIRLLLKSKDRKNHNNLSAISTLLYINSDQKFESIKQLKEYASRS